jgi:hypothetical protein
MGKYHALTAAVLTVLPMLVGCCKHRPLTFVAIGTGEGLIGAGGGHVGDVINWTAQSPDTVGYCVVFRDRSPCQDPYNKDFHVDPKHPVACTVVAPPNLKPGDAMSITYQIVQDPRSGNPTACSLSAPVLNKPVKTVKSQGVNTFSIIPCKGCTATLVDADIASTSVGKAQRAPAPPPPPHNPLPIEITCSSDGTAIIQHPQQACIQMDAVNPQQILWDGNINNVSEPWTASFSTGSICQGTFSDKGPTYCAFDSAAFPQPGQPAVTYSYKTTLASCGQPNSVGNFTLTLASACPATPTPNEITIVGP